MILESVKKEDNQRLTDALAPKLIKYPKFMCFCPKLQDREKFIKAFLSYYLNKWTEEGILLTDDNESLLATLIDTHSFEYKFKGKGAHTLKRSPYSKAIFDHRKNLKEIVHIVAPGRMNPRVLTLYTENEGDEAVVEKVIDEAIEIANENNYTLIYQTFSQKGINLFQRKGFGLAYQSSYNCTRFIETLMVYYPPKADEPRYNPENADEYDEYAEIY